MKRNSRSKEQQKRIGTAEFRNTHLSYTLDMDGVETFVVTAVEDSIVFGAGKRHDLFAWCVMANHVHVLLLPHGKLRKATQEIKGFSAHQINALRNERGRVFWQDESYDHWARDEAEMLRIIQYIEINPVAALLCQRADEWPWSSARFGDGWPPGEAYEKGSRSGFPA
jgi:REP element-mobilizing transposase RayT